MRFTKGIIGFLLFYFTILTSTSFAWTSVQNWETFSPWKSVYGKATIDSSTYYQGDTNSRSLQFKYSAGFLTGYSPDKVSFLFPTQVTEIWFQFYFMYSSGFSWNSTGQKLTFVYNSDGSANWLINSMWGSQTIYTVMQNNFPPGTFSFSSGKNIVAGRWYKIKAHAVMNTVGQADGILQLWLDDALVINSSKGVFRDKDVKWSYMAFDPTYGGGGGNVVNTGYLWIDDTIVSSDPIGDTASPPPPPEPIPALPPPPISQVPLAPANLQIQ